MIYTTLNKIREHGPCKDGWEKLLSFLGKKKAAAAWDAARDEQEAELIRIIS